jgi:hypothetical protein
MVLTTNIKSCMDAAEDEQHLKDKDITVSEVNFTPVRSFDGVKGSVTTSAQSFPLMVLLW